jgi:hypothetical protein
VSHGTSSSLSGFPCTQPTMDSQALLYNLRENWAYFFWYTPTGWAGLWLAMTVWSASALRYIPTAAHTLRAAHSVGPDALRVHDLHGRGVAGLSLPPRDLQPGRPRVRLLLRFPGSVLSVTIDK